MIPGQWLLAQASTSQNLNVIHLYLSAAATLPQQFNFHEIAKREVPL